jgi:4'-phosphopantetheinyl transferase
MRASLPDDEVHAWYVFAADADPDLIDRFRAVLSESERRRAERFHFERDRVLYVVAHGLLRMVLSRYAAIEPAQWRFAAGSAGKPRVVGPGAELGIQFSLSHTHGLAACAVRRGQDIGIDAEHTARPASMEVARRFFAPGELEHLENVAVEDRSAAFFSYWTLKEAYLKARGGGLTLPFRGLEFSLAPDRAPAVSFSDELADSPANWQFFRHAPGPEHCLAVAARVDPRGELKLISRRFESFLQTPR